MLLQSGLSSESVVYLLTLVFNEAIRGSVSEAICSIHASSCSIDGVAISFVGDRGAGKSSLALLMSEYGKYLGDEYAFGDLNNGTLWHQLYPVSIKESGRHLFPSVDFDDALRLTDETQVISYLLPYEHILSQSTISRYSCDSPLFDQPPGLTRPSSGSSYSHSTIQQQNTLQ
jgi:hypothetical protein